MTAAATVACAVAACSVVMAASPAPAVDSRPIEVRVAEPPPPRPPRLVRPRPDTTPPHVRIAVAPPALSSSRSAGFGFHGGDAVAARCALDGHARACASALAASYSGLADGPHTFAVTVRDAAGNQASAAYSWSIDATAPAVRVVRRPTPVTSSRDARVELASSETATWECRLDRGAPVTCGPLWSASHLAPGRHRLAVRASDRAGNAGAPTVVRWRVRPRPRPLQQYTPEPQETPHALLRDARPGR